jgi:AmmeMemoRadiSam system protein A
VEKELLLKIVRDAIKSEFTKEEIDREKLIEENPELKNKGAVFVTLKKDNQQIGCIGSLRAYRPLLDDLISNAKASAFRDPRFPPLEEEELDTIDIEISILSPLRQIFYRDIDDLKSRIRPNIDGIILKLGSCQATFLPQVWKDIPSFDSFFSHLCKKACIDTTNCLDRYPTIFTYRVENIK